MAPTRSRQIQCRLSSAFVAFWTGSVTRWECTVGNAVIPSNSCRFYTRVCVQHGVTREHADSYTLVAQPWEIQLSKQAVVRVFPTLNRRADGYGITSLTMSSCSAKPSISQDSLFATAFKRLPQPLHDAGLPAVHRRRATAHHHCDATHSFTTTIWFQWHSWKEIP